jgi:hypothetical protein
LWLSRRRPCSFMRRPSQVDRPQVRPC